MFPPSIRHSSDQHSTVSPSTLGIHHTQNTLLQAINSVALYTPEESIVKRRMEKKSHEKPHFEQKPTVLSIKDSKASVCLYMRRLSLLCHRDEGQTNPLNRVHCEGWLKTDEQLKAMRLRVPLTLFCIIGGCF